MIERNKNNPARYINNDNDIDNDNDNAVVVVWLDWRWKHTLYLMTEKIIIQFELATQLD